MKIKIFTNVGELLTLKGVEKKDGRHIQESDLGVIKNAVFITQKDRILWLGPSKKLPTLKRLKIDAMDIHEISLKGATVLPGFIECHTHSIFAGERGGEFEQRINGATYLEIAERGGGILSTVKQTREASLENLIASGQKRADHFVRQGVTTLEVKSGYGLRLKDELKMLEAAKSLRGPEIITTYLGPHAVYNEERSIEEYQERILKKDLKAVADSGLADRVDIFIEKGFFDISFAKKYFDLAKKLGFSITVHADQMTRTGATSLGVDCQAQSVDHVIQINPRDINKLAKSGTVAVALPAADFYLKMKYPPARKLIDAGAKVAIATDFNPGSSPTQDLALVGLLARQEMKMTLSEVIAAYTYNAASALGIEDRAGSLKVGGVVDFSVFDSSWRELFYHVGDNDVSQVWKSGKRIFKK